MEENFISKKSILIVFLSSILITICIFLKSYFISSGFVVFCDVGQGDATYIRLKNKIDILIDAGPNKKILSCLGKYMPFYDKTIELAFISHPQKDHFGGYESLLDRYKIKLLFMNVTNIDSQSFNSLMNKINNKDIIIKGFFSGDLITLNKTFIKSLWPEHNVFKKNINKNFDLNELSSILFIKTSKKTLLFTGDIDQDILDEIYKEIPRIDILKVSHHGSKNSLSKKFYYQILPKISVIHVGKNNSYGHPSKEILKILKEIKTDIRRTDEEGDIKINL